ncbi:MAG: glycosyltransferase family 4 protein [Desulfobacterales bacterium]|nr:glycosyltransferase family 4 protein [Desulfobacterales bacterium]
MNILLINHYAGSVEHGMEYRPFYMAREWKKLGHKTLITAASFSHVRSKQPEFKKKIFYESIKGINYLWLKTPSYNGNGVGRIFNMFSFISMLFKQGQAIAREFKPKAVIASSTYPLDIFPAFYISKLSKAKLIFEVHDLWPLSPKELGGYSKYHPFIQIMQIAEDFAYKHADKIVSILPKTKEYMISRGLDPLKFNYIPNGVLIENETKHLPDDIQKILKNLKNNGKFLVCYAGSHGLANALEYFIDAAYLLKDENVAFILVGRGPAKESLKQKAYSLKNVFFFDTIHKLSMPDLLSFMDALYIGLKKETLFRFGISPNKLMDYMLAGKPVIHAIDAGNDIVKESGCGISIEPENPNAVYSAVKNLMALDKNSLEIMGNKGKEFILKNHSYSILSAQFLDVIKGISIEN